jgi:Ca2+-binding EF-hand superfamily protein
MERSVYVNEANIKRAFAYFDQDKDGRITMQNLVEAMGRWVGWGHVRWLVLICRYGMG